MIEENIKNIKQRIKQKAEKVGRNADEITLVAVSKLKPMELIEKAFSLGLRDFGENRTPEFQQKAEALNKEIIWHFVGHLQTRKVKEVVPFANLIHSVDTLKLAGEINKRALNINKIQNVLLEIKTSYEESKAGLVDIDEIKEVLDFCNNAENINVKGFMTMAPFTDDEEQIRESFKKLKNLFEDFNKKGYNLKHLSMGMTNDFEIAIEEGATIVRIGTAIFGKRNYN
jgi:pyridoxal phosphate enzyme (YggS family)